jgi:hypothetical protein
MKTEEIKDEWPRYEETDPPLDLTRENAAFERERARLVRDHLGHIALIHADDVVGAYPTLDEALTEGFNRFGLARLICRVITERDEPEFISHVDLEHPSVRRIDQAP